MAAPATPPTEGEVDHALRQWMTRQLCDNLDIEPADAMAFVKQWEVSLLEAASEAVQQFGYAHNAEDKDAEEGTIVVEEED